MEDKASSSAVNPDESAEKTSLPECPVCLNNPLHPIELPCKHVFCYLCIKGAATRGLRCALCRAPFDNEVLIKPKLVQAETLPEPEKLEESLKEKSLYTWFYEGAHGWWQYEERHVAELEKAYSENAPNVELLIAGYLYVIDLRSFFQFRKDNLRKRRKIKRDLAKSEQKGIAGLKMAARTEKLDQKTLSENEKKSKESDAVDVDSLHVLTSSLSIDPDE